MCLAKSHISNLGDVLNKLESDYEVLKQKQQELDLKLSAMYHEVEVGRYSGVGGYKKLKELQILLRERRIVKNELSKMQQVVHRIDPKKFKEALHTASGVVGKTDKGNQEYCDGWNLSIEEILIR